jgi:glucose-1-phosphatase
VESPSIDIVLFDLGGVLVDFGGVAPMRELARIDSDEELWQRWLTCPWVRRFERGDCSADAFAQGIVADWGLDITAGAYLEAFSSWPGEELAGAVELVTDVKANFAAGCLSNTNALHWEAHRTRWPVIGALDHRFLSFELGAVKPDRQIFDTVAHRLKVDPGRILFLDDNLLNVAGASESGFSAHHVQGVAAARDTLKAAGILRPA